MAQPIVLTNYQLKLIQKIGKGYGDCALFSNISVAGTQHINIDWQISQRAWENLINTINVGCLDLEISREELAAYLDWFARRDRDREDYRQLMGTSQKNTEAEQTLLIFLRLVQAFNYPEDIKRNED